MTQRRDQIAPPFSSTQGFSLVELVIVVVIIALTAAMAVPRLANAAQLRRLDAVAQRVAADLEMARSRANMTSTSVTVTFTFSSNSYQVAGVPDLDRPLTTYTAKLADEPYKATLVSTTLGGQVLTSGTSQVSFDAFGVPSAGGTVIVAVGNASKTITIDAQSGSAVIQ